MEATSCGEAEQAEAISSTPQVASPTLLAKEGSDGLHLEMQNLPAFGLVSIGGLKLILSGPGASGSRPMPDGRQQESGGWNRVVLQVHDLPARIADLKSAGVRFRNEMEAGPGGKQIQIEDPDGNPIELFEPARP